MSNIVGSGSAVHGQCYFCGISTVRGPRRRFRAPIRSYKLTDEYQSTYPYIAEYSRHLFLDMRQVSLSTYKINIDTYTKMILLFMCIN